MKARDESGVGRDEESHGEESDAKGDAECPAEAPGLLEEDHHCERGHPNEVHNPDRDQDGEQCPAAADAVTAVVHPDAHIAEPPGVPAEVEEEPERGPAMAEAAVLERGELVEAGRTEDGGAHRT